MANDAYLLLGSNIEPERHLAEAVVMLQRFGRISRVSRVWESLPVDGSERPNYLNAAVVLQTDLSAAELRLSAIDSIETSLQRVRDPGDKNADRTIDIDVVLFNRDITTIEHRRIPDPEIADRAFALQSLVDIDPDYVHPETGLSLRDMLSETPGVGQLKERSDVDLRAAMESRGSDASSVGLEGPVS